MWVLEEDDLDRFHELSDAIAELQEQIGAAASDDAGAIIPGSDHAREAARVLEDARARAERIRSRLATLRAQGAEAVRRESRRRPQARTYVAEPGVAPASTLDVKL